MTHYNRDGTGCLGGSGILTLWCADEAVCAACGPGPARALSRGSKCRKTSLARWCSTIVLMMGGTPVPRTPRWYTLSVTTDSPDANDTRQMLTP